MNSKFITNRIKYNRRIKSPQFLPQCKLKMNDFYQNWIRIEMCHDLCVDSFDVNNFIEMKCDSSLENKFDFHLSKRLLIEMLELRTICHLKEIEILKSHFFFFRNKIFRYLLRFASLWHECNCFEFFFKFILFSYSAHLECITLRSIG